MLKMLLLYRRFFRDTLLTMAGYVVILVAGVWLTDISLFESYVLATPLLAMVLPAVFANNALTNLALSFGASRRLCYWGRQAGSVLVAACCMGMTWLTYRLAEGGMAEPPARRCVELGYGGAAVRRLPVCPAVEYPFADDGKRLAAHGGAGRGLGAGLCFYRGGAGVFAH